MLPDYKDIVSYILKNYPHARKIVEVGIGGEDSVYKELKKIPDLEVVATDISSEKDVSFDDVLKPNMNLYKGAVLIYSIRPPPELIPPLQRIAEDVGASLLIRPLSTDSCSKPGSMKLVNYGKAVLWVYER